MGKRDVIKKLRQYKILVSGYFDVDKVILFGSYATGRQNPDSDIDVAIIVNSIDTDFFSYAPLLWKLRQEVDDRIEQPYCRAKTVIRRQNSLAIDVG